MANANKNKNVVQEPQTVVEQVQPGTDNISESTATPGANEGSEQEHTTTQGQPGSGEQTDDKGSTEVDTQNQDESAGEKGSETGGTGDGTDVEKQANVETKPEPKSVT
jgi:hypothetical protein